MGPVRKRQTTILLENKSDVTMNLQNLRLQYNPRFPLTLMLTMKQLILGGARSGKSLLAERRAADSGRRVVYLATAEAKDGEMQRRIDHHRTRRPPEWECAEETLHLAARLRQLATPDTCILVDCLTLWLSNLLFAGQAAAQAEAGETVDCPLLVGETGALLETLPRLPGQVILVSNEVGWGIVPMSPLSRLFADEQGRLNQRLAAVCDRVTLVAAGLPLELKMPMEC
jgi:adenosylcobinamide kinase/adenosylcobinamide-phosphate guanylyltransferase